MKEKLSKSNNKTNKRNNEISEELLDKYFNVAKKALDKVKIVKIDKKEIEWEKTAELYLDMASRYVKDAHYFAEKGDIPRAFGALNYAHGWLDAGARIGLFDVDGDSVLFTVD